MGDTNATWPGSRPGASAQQFGRAPNNPGGSTSPSIGTNATGTATNPFFAHGGHNNASNPITPHTSQHDPGTSYTMIYPIRSLLSDVQPSSGPPTPELSTTTRTLTSEDHRLPSTSIETGGDPGSTSMIRPGLHRRVSIQQRRTAQWQANISNRRPTGSGWLSSPTGWDPRGQDRNNHRDSGLVPSPQTRSPEPNENPDGETWHTESPHDLPTLTPGGSRQRPPPQSVSSGSSNRRRTSSPQASSKPTRLHLTHAQPNPTHPSPYLPTPEQQLTQSNIELKAFRDLLGSSFNLPNMNIGSGKMGPHPHSHFGSSTTGSTSDPGTGARSNPAARTAAPVETTVALDVGANPTGSGSGGSSGTLGITAKDDNNNRNRGSDVTGTSAGEAGERASLVAGGYVHLGPVRPSDADRYSDGGGGSVRSASVRLGTSATSGSGHHHRHHHQHHHLHGGSMPPAGELDASSSGHGAKSGPSAPGFNPDENGSSNGGNGNGGGNRLASASRQSHSRSDSAFRDERPGFPPSLTGGLLSVGAGVGVQDPTHSHSLRRGSSNMGAPPTNDYGNGNGTSNDGTGANIGPGGSTGHHGGPYNAHTSDNPFPQFGDSSASLNSSSINNDSSVSTSSEAGGDADVENEGENSAQDRSESSLSNYPKTSRFQHVETENGHHVLLGREGTLKRCEDEPIHIPGAVQGFGVLIALEEDLDSGNLVVRVVSENCSEILGLTPSYLFNLECFTHTLPQIQADTLWDNIQYLPESGTADLPIDGTADEAPQIFLLSGYGQPGSAVVLDRDGSRGSGSDQGSSSAGYPSSRGQYSSASSSSTKERRQWSCWCAAHKPKMSPQPASAPGESSILTQNNPPSSKVDARIPSAAAHGSLIILELELEPDMYNPLYPPPMDPLSTGGNSPIQSTASVGSGGSSSAGVAGGGGGSGGSAGRTSEGSDRTPTASSITPLVINTGTPSESGAGTSGTAMTGGMSMTPTAAHDANATPTESNREADLIGPTAEQAQLHIGGPGGPDEDEASWGPTAEQILASTTSKAQPIRALERMRQAERRATQRRLASLKRGSGRDVHGRRLHHHRGGRLAYAGSGSLDVFSVLGQVNEQLSSANDLQTFLDVVVGIMKDLTQFHRVLAYQFDELANGQVVAELVDYTKTKELYRGLHFPAADIPPQARELYKINKVRSLYDRDQITARLVGRSKADVETPLDLTHSYLRAMSPIHLKYLKNMGVRSSMSISIVTFGQLWGLVCCHSFGDYGTRVSFPVRQMLRLLSDSISRGIERVSYTHRLHTRKLISTIPTEAHPTGHIVSNAEDLLGLFDADFGVLVIGEGAKILGPNENGQDILIIAEYLRVKQYKIMQVTQDITKDFPDINLRAGPNVIAGVLHVPLSAGGKDFIAFLRKGQLREVTWAGRASKGGGGLASLEPRASFKAWSEVISSRSRSWTDEQLETAGVLALVYGKFIDVWRQKETAVKATQLTNLLLSNASHEVRTPLNHIINYLELAMNGPLDRETRENLSMSHAASKNLLFTINDLLDLTRLESGNETSLSEPFDFPATIDDAVQAYRTEAERRNIKFTIVVENLPKMVIGDAKKIRTVVANLTANAVKYTETGEIRVEARQSPESQGLQDSSQVVVEVTVADTGCGIDGSKLEKIFRELEQVEHSTNKNDQDHSSTGLGLGLAVVAHIIGQLRGQLRVDSKPGVGSQFVFLIPFHLPRSHSSRSSNSSSRALSFSSVGGSRGSEGQDEIENLVEALAGSPLGNTSLSPADRRGSQPELAAMDPRTDSTSAKAVARALLPLERRPVSEGEVELQDTNFPLPSLRVDPVDVEPVASIPLPKKAWLPVKLTEKTWKEASRKQRKTAPPPSFASDKPSFKVLIVEDDVVNRNVLAKRLKMDGHEVSTSVNGQEAVDLIEKYRAFDCILMDIQMPILDGFGAAQQIRRIEKACPLPLDAIQPSTDLNGGIPIFAVSTSLKESQREYMMAMGMDAWILKPIDFKRLSVLMRGVTDVGQRRSEMYKLGVNWEKGGWMREAVGTVPALPPSSGSAGRSV